MLTGLLRSTIPQLLFATPVQGSAVVCPSNESASEFALTVASSWIVSASAGVRAVGCAYARVWPVINVSEATAPLMSRVPGVKVISSESTSCICTKSALASLLVTVISTRTVSCGVAIVCMGKTPGFTSTLRTTSSVRRGTVAQPIAPTPNAGGRPTRQFWTSPPAGTTPRSTVV